MTTEIERHDGAHSLGNGLAEVQIEHRNALRLLGALPPSTFTAMVDEMALGRQRLLQVMQKLMVLGVHYGTIPGTQKPTLFKPGAELLCQLFGFVAEPDAVVTTGDGESQPDISVQVVCRLRHVGSGGIAAAGVGSANTWEVRYRYRMGQKTCPNCQSSGTIVRLTKYDGQPWLCHPAKGGCGAKFAGNDRAITGQLGRAENSDPYDLHNTILKMAKKRALVDAIIAATAASDLWTQDHEDDVKAPAFEVKRAPAEPAQKPSQAAAPKAPPAGAAEDDAPPPPDEAPPPGNGEKSARQQLADCYTGAAKTAGVRPTPNGLVALAIRVLREQGEDLPDGAKLASLTDAQCEIVRKHIQRVGVE